MLESTAQTNTGVPTPNKGVIYSRRLLEDAIEEYLTRDERYGMLECLPEIESFELDYERISHQVKDVFLDEQGCLCVEVILLDTPNGRLIEFTPDLVQPSVSAIGFYGWEDGSNVVEEAALLQVNRTWRKNLSRQ